jgi:hypothetical protein
MLKNLLIFALLLGLFAYGHGDDRQPAAGAPQSQKPANPTAPAAADEHSGSAVQGADSQNQGAHEPKCVRVILPPKDNYDYILFAANILLVIVGFCGVGIGIRTLRAIRKQANIQAAGMRQWVDVQVTSSDCNCVFELGGIKYEADKVNIWFSVSNETTYPLTIQEVFVKTSVSGSDEPKWDIYKGEEEVILSPGKGREVVIGRKNIHDYHFVVVLNLDQARAEEYIAHKLHVSVSGYVRFQPVIGEIEKQSFGYLVSCGPNKAAMVSLGLKLKKDKETGT